MKPIVIYKTKYGSTKTYAEWISGELCCPCREVKTVTVTELSEYDTIIYGGGLYAEIINGVGFITKNFDALKDKKIAVFTSGITPVDCRDYYDKMVIEKNFKCGVPGNVRVFNFLGKMIFDELSFVHRNALKALKKIMSSKQNPTEMERLLCELCDADGDFTDKGAISELLEYVRS